MSFNLTMGLFTLSLMVIDILIHRYVWAVLQFFLSVANFWCYFHYRAKIKKASMKFKKRTLDD